MTEHDPSIDYLDFPTPKVADVHGIRLESLEERRSELVRLFFHHMLVLNEIHGPIDPENVEQSSRRKKLLEALMHAENTGPVLAAGLLMQINAPKLIYPEGFCAEFTAGESVRARAGSLTVHLHFEVADDGELAQDLVFGLNLQVVDPVVITPGNAEPLGGITGSTPVVSLHEKSLDMWRVVETR